MWMCSSPALSKPSPDLEAMGARTAGQWSGCLCAKRRRGFTGIVVGQARGTATGQSEFDAATVSDRLDTGATANTSRSNDA